MVIKLHHHHLVEPLARTVIKHHKEEQVGLGAKSKPYDKQRAASGPAGGVRPSRPYRSGQDQPAITPAEKQRREAEKKKKKKKGKGIDFGKFAKDAVGAAARYDVSPEVKTKEAEDFAKV